MFGTFIANLLPVFLAGVSAGPGTGTGAEVSGKAQGTCPSSWPGEITDGEDSGMVSSACWA